VTTKSGGFDCLERTERAGDDRPARHVRAVPVEDVLLEVALVVARVRAVRAEEFLRRRTGAGRMDGLDMVAETVAGRQPAAAVRTVVRPPGLDGHLTESDVRPHRSKLHQSPALLARQGRVATGRGAVVGDGVTGEVGAGDGDVSAAGELARMRADVVGNAPAVLADEMVQQAAHGVKETSERSAVSISGAVQRTFRPTHGTRQDLRNAIAANDNVVADDVLPESGPRRKHVRASIGSGAEETAELKVDEGGHSAARCTMPVLLPMDLIRGGSQGYETTSRFGTGELLDVRRNRSIVHPNVVTKPAGNLNPDVQIAVDPRSRHNKAHRAMLAG